MKKIEAIIRKTKFEDVKDALLEADIEWFSYYDVRGIGKARQGRIYRGVVYDTSSIERILVSIVVREKNVEKTVQAIIKAAHTGEIGDGRIFVIPIEDAVRIRTGERGDIALYNAEQENKRKLLPFTGKSKVGNKTILQRKRENYGYYTLIYAPRRPLGARCRRGSHHRGARCNRRGPGRTCYRTQHCMDATCCHAGILHATGIRLGRSRIHPYQEHGQRADENLVDFMFGSVLFWFIGFGLMFGIGGFVGAPHF